MDDKRTAIERFKADPAEFCKEFLTNSENYRNEMEEIDRLNFGFYEGRDPVLEDRETKGAEQEGGVQRSALFVQIIASAVDTNVSDAVASINSSPNPVTIRPFLSEKGWEVLRQQRYATDPYYGQFTYAQLLERVTALERTLNIQLRQCGYVPFGFEEHVRGAEIFRTPTFVKVGWQRSAKPIAEVVPKIVAGETEESGALSAMLDDAEGERKIRFGTIREGSPSIQYIPGSEMAYEPYISQHQFHTNATMCAHIAYRSKEELLDDADLYDYDPDIIEEYFKEANPRGESSSVRDSADKSKKEITLARDQSVWEPFRGKRARVAEVFLSFPNKQSGSYHSRVFKQVTLLGFKTPINIDKNYPPVCRGVGFPFVPLTSSQTPGMMEGISTVDQAMGHQRLYSDVYNAFFDIIGYTCFPVFKNRVGNVIKGSGRMFPGAILDMFDPDSFQQLVTQFPQVGQLLEAADRIDQSMKQMVNTTNLREGSAGNPYEKATSAKLRSVGAARRAVPKNARYGSGLQKVAELVLAYNQEYAPNKEDFVVPGGVIIDTPAFTYGYDDDTVKQDTILLLDTFSKSPNFQSPDGRRKLAALERRLAGVMDKDRGEMYAMSDEEIERAIQLETEAAKLMNQQAATQTGAPQPGAAQ